MIQELHNESIRLRNLYAQKMLPSNEMMKSSDRSSLPVAADKLVSSNAAAARSTRSSGLDADFGTADSKLEMLFRGPGTDFTSLLGGGAQSSSRSRSRKAGANGGVAPALEQVLPESSMRCVGNSFAVSVRAVFLMTFSVKIGLAGNCERFAESSQCISAVQTQSE